MLIYPVIAIVSASGLILQISLTRIFAVAAVPLCLSFREPGVPGPRGKREPDDALA